jgi:predicted RNA-binding protein associated with RNAse of E/G family
MWASGETVALRYIRYGQVRRASPHLVVRDDGDLVVLHIPVGAQAKTAVSDGPATGPIRGQADREWELQDLTWHSYRVLRLMRWGERHSLELFWHEESDEFAGWYVNLQEPLRRSPVGFDTDDLVLDIWVEPNGVWEWKDEDELEEAVRLGRFTPAEAAAVRAEGERVIAARPWPTGWEDWKPDPSWPVPELPEGWDVV